MGLSASCLIPRKTARAAPRSLAAEFSMAACRRAINAASAPGWPADSLASAPVLASESWAAQKAFFQIIKAGGYKAEIIGR